jgi:hypothetical protein
LAHGFVYIQSWPKLPRGEVSLASPNH